MYSKFKQIISFSFLVSLPLMAIEPRMNAEKRVDLNELDLENYNYKVGDLYYTPSFRASLGYDDNSSYSTNSDKDNGAYTETALSLNLYRQFFPGFKINTDFEVGYRETFGNNSDDGLILNGSSGGLSEIAFDFDINEKMTFSLFNQAGVGVQQISDNRDNQNSQTERFWDNDLGALLHREITEDTGISLAGGIRSRRDIENSDNGSKEFDQYYTGLTLDHQLNARVSINPFINYSSQQWVDGNNDVDETIVGLSSDILITDRISLNLVGGYQYQEYSGSKKNYTDVNGTYVLDDTEENFTGSFTLNHIVTDKFMHGINGSYGMRPTTISNANASEEYQLGYSAQYQINEKLTFSGSFNWLRGEDQASDGRGETYDVYQPNATLLYKISARQDINFKCSYTNKTSDAKDFSGNSNEYEATELSVNYIYRF